MIVRKKLSGKILKKCLKNEKKFIGCYSMSNLPTFPKVLPATMIINIDNIHWVALVLTDKNCFYFDSLAVPIKKRLLNFINIRYSMYYFNNNKIQCKKSNACGLYCCAFIKFVKTKTSYCNFLNFFSYKTVRNDDIVINKLLITLFDYFIHLTF